MTCPNLLPKIVKDGFDEFNTPRLFAVLNDLANKGQHPSRTFRIIATANEASRTVTVNHVRKMADYCSYVLPTG